MVLTNHTPQRNRHRWNPTPDRNRTIFYGPGSPWRNCCIKSCNARFRDEFLSEESFTSLLEAMGLSPEYRDQYNYRRPHSSLGHLTPAGFAADVSRGQRTDRFPRLGGIRTTGQGDCAAPLPFDFSESD